MVHCKVAILLTMYLGVRFYCCLLVCTIACLRSMVLALLPYFLMCGCHISSEAVNRFRFFLEFGK
jgi:hypothetical protein